jgi:hypothetical protein
MSDFQYIHTDELEHVQGCGPILQRLAGAAKTFAGGGLSGLGQSIQNGTIGQGGGWRSFVGQGLAALGGKMAQ